MSRNILMFLSVILIMVIPVPGRFAYGIVMVVEFLFLMLLGILFRRLVKKIQMEEFKNFLVPLVMVASSVIFRQLLILISPLMAFTLGYAIYMPAVSAFILETVIDESGRKVMLEIKDKLMVTLSLSVPVAVIFLVRDIVGYGTLTLPASNNLFALRIIPEMDGFFMPTVFFASIPGAFMLIALSLFIINRIGPKWAKDDNDYEAQVNQVPDTKSELEQAATMETPIQNQKTENTVPENNAESSMPNISAEEKIEKDETPSFENLRGLDTTSLSDSLTFPDAPSLLNLDDIMGDNYGD